MRGLFRTMLERNGYTNDGQYDWILKKEGNQQQLRSQQMQEERKASLPARTPARHQIGSAGMGQARASSKNLQDMQEERKERRANMGAQVIASNQRNTARVGAVGQRTPTNPMNEFANAPQYTKGGH